MLAMIYDGFAEGFDIAEDNSVGGSGGTDLILLLGVDLKHPVNDCADDT